MNSAATLAEPSPEEMAEMAKLFGGVARPIVRTPEDEAYLDRHLAYVARTGHQP